jgi:arylsulfatase A-like enzyme
MSRPRWLAPSRYPEEAYEESGVDRIALFDAGRALYDETMAHQDWQLGQLVERLKAQGEWEHTVLIVAADHGNEHGLGVFDPLPEPAWQSRLRTYVTHIPLVVVWPEKIPGGRRFAQPVSMIDMLPTILDLAGLPLPDVLQGRSLAPLLLGEVSEAEWEPRPVIFDEFYVNWDNGQLEGSIEMIDGRWGAALRIEAEDEEPEDEKPRLLLYDLWNDPYALTSVHEEHQELVEKYTAMLEELWEAHQALAQQFSRTGEVPLTREQLETLRSLGYIQ